MAEGIAAATKAGREPNLAAVSVPGTYAAVVAEQALYDLQAPVRRVTGYDTIMPLYRLESAYIPGVNRIVTAVRECLSE